MPNRSRRDACEGASCAQKIHAVSAKRTERGRELIDVQLLDQAGGLDLRQAVATCARPFGYRQQQAWPPSFVVGERWDTLYAEASDGLGVAPSVDDAVVWANDFVERIPTAE